MRPATSQDGVWPPRSYEGLERLPTEPAALREFVSANFGSGDEMVYLGLSMLLHGRRVEPPGLRRAAVEVLADTPGVTITDGETDARGREGIGIGGPRSAPDWRIILDPETYAYLGSATRSSATTA